MKSKYIINLDNEGLIHFVGINVSDGLVIKQIINQDDASKYMKQVKEINKEYGNFFRDYFDEKCEIKSSEFFKEEMKKQSEIKSTDDLFIITNEEELPKESNINNILDEVSRNSISVSEDNKITPHGIATKIAQLRDGMSEFYPGNIDLAINFNFVRVVDKDGKHIDNDISKKIEDSIVKVSANLTSSDTMFFTEPVNAFLDRRISGYVDFSKFIKNLSDLGYSMASNDWMMSDRKFEKNYISDLYDENGNLDLSVLKSTANTDDRFGCIFNKTDNLKRADNDKKNGISR